MSTAQDVRRKRIQSDKDTLEQLDDSARHLRQARADAQGELVAAQAKLDAIDLALDDVQNRRRTLSKSLDVTRSAFLLALWADVMPADVLRAIFLAVHALPDKKWLTPDHAMHNKARARRPFRLSAVCRQWRKVALDTSGLWTYISPNDKFPDVHGDLRAVDVALIRTLLRRSRRAPLDVAVIWSHIVCSKGDNLCEALALIGEHSTRLKRVYIRLPSGVPRQPSMDMFRSPTPALEQLVISTEDDNWEEAGSNTYFPDVRSLRHLELSKTEVSCSPRHCSLDSLRVLKLWATSYLDAKTMTLISKAAPTIEEMLLWYDEVHENVKLEAVTPVCFPNLHTLSITGSTQLMAHITTPKLQCLSLDVDEMDTDDLPQFFDAVAPTVTSLVLEGISTCADHLHHLQPLYNVESLSFLSLSGDECVVDDDFFVALAETSPVIWPKLTKVAIGSTGQIDPHTNDGIIQLVQARRTVDTLDNAIEAPRQIVEVDLRCKDVPNWIHATIDHLLASPGPDSATTIAHGLG